MMNRRAPNTAFPLEPDSGRCRRTVGLREGVRSRRSEIIRHALAGSLWVQEWTVSTSERHHWWVLDPEGRLLGRVRTPEGLRVTEIGEAYVLGVWRPDDGVEFVQMHRLER